MRKKMALSVQTILAALALLLSVAAVVAPKYNIHLVAVATMLLSVAMLVS
jgi:hypothetical protein